MAKASKIKGYQKLMEHDHEWREKMTKLPILEARRTHGPIYAALLAELYEETLFTTAKHFECLIATENELLEQQAISERISVNLDFLVLIFEKARTAERLYKADNVKNRLCTLQQLYSLIQMMQKAESKYDWLLGKMFSIITKVLRKFGENDIKTNEVKARILHKYGAYLLEKGEKYPIALESLIIAIDICRGQGWELDNEFENTSKATNLHSSCAQILAQVYMIYGEKFVKDKPEYALKLANKAILTLAEVGLNTNVYLVVKAYVVQITFMLECNRSKQALKEIIGVYKYVENAKGPLLQLKCDLLYQHGICYYNLNETDNSLQKFRETYALSRQCNYRDLDGNLLFYMGLAFMKPPKRETKARSALEAARRNYQEHKETANVMKTSFMLATLKYNQTFPALTKVIKSTDACQFYNLRKWKNQKEPFWNETEKETEHTESELFHLPDPENPSADLIEIKYPCKETDNMFGCLIYESDLHKQQEVMYEQKRIQDAFLFVDQIGKVEEEQSIYLDGEGEQIYNAELDSEIEKQIENDDDDNKTEKKNSSIGMTDIGRDIVENVFN